MDLFKGLARSHVLSPCGFYRYELRETWAAADGLLYLGCLNPSTATDDQDDHTTRKIRGFTERLGLGGWVLWNLYAYRATHPRDLWQVSDPVGPDNDRHTMRILNEAAGSPGARILVAWGGNAKLDRVRQVRALLEAAGVSGRTECFGYTANAEPLHPLMLAYETALEPYLFT